MFLKRIDMDGIETLYGKLGAKYRWIKWLRGPAAESNEIVLGVLWAKLRRTGVRPAQEVSVDRASKFLRRYSLTSWAGLTPVLESAWEWS